MYNGTQLAYMSDKPSDILTKLNLFIPKNQKVK